MSHFTSKKTNTEILLTSLQVDVLSLLHFLFFRGVHFVFLHFLFFRGVHIVLSFTFACVFFYRVDVLLSLSSSHNSTRPSAVTTVKCVAESLTAAARASVPE